MADQALTAVHIERDRTVERLAGEHHDRRAGLEPHRPEIAEAVRLFRRDPAKLDQLTGRHLQQRRPDNFLNGEVGSRNRIAVRIGRRVPERARWVVVHDGVRPFIDARLVERVRAAAAGGAATCGLPVRETVKRVRQGSVEATIDRDGLWTTQTPQVFTRALLWEAHEKARRDGFAGTDDAVLVERLGTAVAMVPGLEQNLKITTREDLRTARAWASRRRA